MDRHDTAGLHGRDQFLELFRPGMPRGVMVDQRDTRRRQICPQRDARGLGQVPVRSRPHDCADLRSERGHQAPELRLERADEHVLGRLGGQVLGEQPLGEHVDDTVELLGLQDPDPLVLRQVDVHARPVVTHLRDGGLPRGSGDVGSVQVDHDVAIGAQCRAVRRDQTVDVLRRAQHDDEALGGAECRGHVHLDLGLGRLRLARLAEILAMDARALAHEHVDIRRRVEQQLIEQRASAAVPAEVAGVEQSAAARLDQQRVRVERAVVVQVRRDRERPEHERRTVRQVPRLGEVDADAGAPEVGGAQDVGRGLAHIPRHVRVDARHQAPVVLVPVGKDHAEQVRVVARGQTRDVRQGRVAVVLGGRRAPDVEHEPEAVLLELDAAAADLADPAVDARPHRDAPTSRPSASTNASFG